MLKSVTTNLFIVDCWADSGKDPTELLVRVDFYQNVSVDSQERQRNNKHYLNSKETPREMPRTNCESLHGICRFETVSCVDVFGKLQQSLAVQPGW